MNTPLPNPLSPSPKYFLALLWGTRKRLRALRYWAPVTGTLRESEINQPFVSVMLITYNHGKYVRRAIESILMQVRNFPIEINVIDDASTDNTQQIIEEYRVRYPDVVNCYFNPNNVGHIATQLNTIRGFMTLRGRYFAILEGDDYWTDSNKLTKQVGFLEGNAEFVACAHNTLKVFDDGSRPSEHFLPFKAFRSKVATTYDLISMSGVFHLSSVVYRNVFLQSPPLCLGDPYSCEVTINMLYGTFGNFFCFDDYMSVYRVHGGGVFSGRTQERHWLFHLHGFFRFTLYLGAKYWCMFARSVRGFSRYVLVAPFRTREVARLAFGTVVLFSVSFIVATSAYFVCDLWRGMRFVGSVIRNICIGRFSRAGQDLLWGLLVFQRSVVGVLPDAMVHRILRFELRYSRWCAARRAARDWVVRKHGELQHNRLRPPPS